MFGLVLLAKACQIGIFFRSIMSEKQMWQALLGAFLKAHLATLATNDLYLLSG